MNKSHKLEITFLKAFCIATVYEMPPGSQTEYNFAGNGGNLMKLIYNAACVPIVCAILFCVCYSIFFHESVVTF